MSGNIYPLKFDPIYHRALWGGNRIAKTYGRKVYLLHCSESWEIADRSPENSIIRNGALAKTSLRDLLAMEPACILGFDAQTSHFPLLLKIIDAQKCLSVQVHPTDTVAKRMGTEPKAEMWYVLQATPEAAVYAGFIDGVTRNDVEQAIENKTLPSLLRRIPVTQGDVINIPAGCVHAIDAGCLVYEIQQNSDTTYRLYDWDRLDDDGHPRPLHIQESLASINWNPTEPIIPVPVQLNNDQHGICLNRTKYFQVSTGHADLPVKIHNNINTFTVYFVTNGSISVEGSGVRENIRTGQTVLFPAACPDVTFDPGDGAADWLEISLPHDDS
ncbi:MAG: mannose-6-phosphate isomerase [Spartobacteria bacterium]|nr:mannose-6-phosphate isomerase [Spartobacteria bacterium]